MAAVVVDGVLRTSSSLVAADVVVVVVAADVVVVVLEQLRIALASVPVRPLRLSTHTFSRKYRMLYY